MQYKTIMNRLLTLAVLSLSAVFAMAQPKNAGRALLKLTTYDEAGKVVKTVNAFVCGDASTAVASFDAFNGAARAVAVDLKGTTYNVVRILGASNDYDLVKFSIDGKGAPLPLLEGSGKNQKAGTTLYLVSSPDGKREVVTRASVLKAEEYENYGFYDVTVANTAAHFGCPLVDARGNVVAVVKKNLSKGAANAYAVDVHLANDLCINAQSALNSDLRKILMPKALPAEEKDAYSYVYLMGNLNDSQYGTALSDFISAWPNNPEGYVMRADASVANKDYAQADADYAKALSLANDNFRADAIHYAYSRAIYNRCLDEKDGQAGTWTFDKSYDEAVMAYDANPLSQYLVQQGCCLFAKKDYVAAREKFRQVNAGHYGTNETFYYEVLSAERCGASQQEVLTLMDSVVAHCTKPYDLTAAQYLFERARRLDQAGEYRKAYADLKDYEQTVGPRRLTDEFYYQRGKVAEKAKMYQQALEDLETARGFNASSRDFYDLEIAALYVNIGEYDKAISLCEEILKNLPESADCYRFMGICYGEKGNKTKAKENFNRAKQLGDDTADGLMQKYM